MINPILEMSERDKRLQESIKQMYEWIQETEYTIMLSLGADLKLKKTGETKREMDLNQKPTSSP